MGYEIRDRVARITINRPARRNSLTWAAIGELARRLTDARDDPDVRVVVLTGAGEAAFCSGIDLADMGRGDPDLLAGLFEQLWGLGKPTIAAVRGFALAGGFGLALACDVVVCADHSIFGAPEIDLGLWPFVITVPLVRSMPPKKALELMLTGRRVGAEEAARIGFVNRVVPATELESAVSELAATLAAKPPGAVKAGRDAFYAVWDMAAADALASLAPLLAAATATGEAVEGIAAFNQKRPPSWR